MNKKKLLKLANAIENADQSKDSQFAFDMKVFYDRKHATKHPCGTAACIQGWAQYIDPDHEAWDSSLASGVRFAIWAGIEKWQAEIICVPDVILLVKQHHAVEMLRNFVETGEVVWSIE